MMNLLILEDTYPHKALEAAKILQEKHALDVEVTEFPARILQAIKESPPDNLLLDMMVPAEPDPQAEINVLLKDYTEKLKALRPGDFPLRDALTRYPKEIIAADKAFELTIQLLEAGTGHVLIRDAVQFFLKHAWKDASTHAQYDKIAILLGKLLEAANHAANRIPLPYGGPLALRASIAGLNVGIISDTHVHQTLLKYICSPEALNEGREIKYQDITWMSILFVSLPLVAQGLFTIPEVIEGGARGHFFGPRRFPGEASSITESFKVKVENWVLAAETLIGHRKKK